MPRRAGNVWVWPDGHGSCTSRGRRLDRRLLSYSAGGDE